MGWIMNRLFVPDLHHGLTNTMQVFRPDEFIMKEGEPADRIYILAKGRAEVRTCYM